MWIDEPVCYRLVAGSNPAREPLQISGADIPPEFAADCLTQWKLDSGCSLAFTLSIAGRASRLRSAGRIFHAPQAPSARAFGQSRRTRILWFNFGLFFILTEILIVHRFKFANLRDCSTTKTTHPAAVRRRSPNKQRRISKRSGWTVSPENFLDW